MTFNPAPSSDGRRALALAGILVVVDILLLWGVLDQPASGGAFILLLVALALLAPLAYLTWRAWTCLSLEYWIDRNAVSVIWGPLRQVIPLGDITRVQRGAVQSPQPHWLDRWPRVKPWLVFGSNLNKIHSLEGQQVISLASRPLPEQLLLVTESTTFGISPAVPDRFLEALEEHHQIGPTRLVAAERRLPGLVRAALWRDPLSLGLLGGGLAGAVVVLGFLMFRYPGLPSGLSQLGGRSPSTLFLLPGFALLVWLVNGAWGLMTYPRERIAARLLWGGALLAQIAALVALLTLT